MKAEVTKDAVQAGIADAFDFWLSQHPMTLSDLFEGIRNAMATWLNTHEDEIVEAIARRANP